MNSKKKFVVEYSDENGLSCRDADAIEFAFNAFKSGLRISVGTAILVDAFRLLVARGDIDCQDIEFEFCGKRIRCDKHGNLERTPRDFAFKHMDILLELLSLADGMS